MNFSKANKMDIAEKNLREKFKKKFPEGKMLIEDSSLNEDQLVENVKKDAYFHLMEGGSDGTLGHAIWLDTFGKLEPEINVLANQFEFYDEDDDWDDED